jgi:glycosyltransferase involved in cell wall biosynthesis
MAKKIQFPAVSVVIPTFNSEKTLDRCLRLVRSQKYPSPIEIVLGDGGSTDTTLAIAKKHKAKVIKIPPSEQRSEYNRGVAFNAAKNEFVLVIDHDNFLPYQTWLQDMVTPLLNHPKMVATETSYYHYDKKYSLIDRYFALYGTSEPLPYYLGKADRMPQTSKNWSLLGKAQDMGKYYLVHFENDPRKIPTIGTNGCLMRKSILMKYADVRPDHHYPIDVMVDVIKKGHNEFGFVKNSIIHLTNERGVWSFFLRRFRFVTKYYFQEHAKRRYSVFMKGDEKKLLLYLFYTVTIVKPLYDATRGFMKIPDPAWFLQPVMCLVTTVMYSFATIKRKFSL